MTYWPSARPRKKGAADGTPVGDLSSVTPLYTRRSETNGKNRNPPGRMLSVTPKSQPPPLKSNRDGSTGISSEIPTVMQRRTPPRNNDRAALFPTQKRESVPLNAGFKEPEQENRPVPMPAPPRSRGITQDRQQPYPVQTVS